jgi:hypothetical protein
VRSNPTQLSTVPSESTESHGVGAFASILNRSRRLLGCEEVDHDRLLKVICACLLFYFHMTFHFWRQQSESLSTQGNEAFNYVPAALFQNLRSLVFMDAFQTETYLYLLGMLALLGMFSLFYFRSSLLPMGLLAFLFLNKVFFYLCDLRLVANYHHFHLLLTLIFLVSTEKMRSFRAALALSYVMSAIVKLTPSWLYGEYFNSLPDKLPLLPKESWIVTSASVGLIALELLGPLCWFTRIAWLRRLSFWLFVLFHLYSGVIVGYWYTSLMLPVVVTAFVGFDQPLQAGFRFSRRHAPTLAVFALALCGSFYHLLIPGDARLTAEGKYFGLFMFDANRSVRFETDIQKGTNYWSIQVLRSWRRTGDPVGYDSGTKIFCQYYQNGWLSNSFAVTQPIRDGKEIVFNPQYFLRSGIRTYGDPYLYHFYARELMRRYRPDLLTLRLDERLDGHPEAARLLDVDDYGELNPSYDPFRHNAWIKQPGPESPPEYRWP